MRVVSIEVAKLARDHEFHAPVMMFYHEKPNKIATVALPWDDGERDVNDKNGEFYDKNCYSAPEHALLEEWFRVKHDIHVLVIPIIEGYQGIVLTRKDIISIDKGEDTYSDYFLFDWDDYYNAYDFAFKQAFIKLK